MIMFDHKVFHSDVTKRDFKEKLTAGLNQTEVTTSVVLNIIKGGYNSEKQIFFDELNRFLMSKPSE